MPPWLTTVADWLPRVLMWAAAGLLAIYGKRLIQWMLATLGRAIVSEVGDELEPRWKASIDEGLAPINDELRIGESAAKWPNGSSSLPESVTEIYRRQAETHQMVRTISEQLEDVLTATPPRRPPPDEPTGTPI